MGRRRTPVAAWALTAALVALAGCGQNDSAAGGPGAAAGSAAPSANTAVSPEPAKPQPASPGGAPPASSTDAPVAPDQAPDSAAAAPKAALTTAALRTAAQSYVDGLLTGDLDKVVPYLDSSCTDQDRAGLIVAIGSVKKLAKGATMDVTATRVVGRRGNVTAYKLSAKAPAGLRQVLAEQFQQETSNPWRWVNGHWFNTGPCSGGSPNPGSSVAPGPTRPA